MKMTSFERRKVAAISYNATIAYRAVRDADETFRAKRRMALNDFNTAMDAAEDKRFYVTDIFKKIVYAAGEKLIQAEITAQIKFAAKYFASAGTTREGVITRMAADAAIRRARRRNCRTILTQALAARAQAQEAARNKRKDNS